MNSINFVSAITEDRCGSSAALEDALFAILLASGFSRRFGDENKLLVPFQGMPLARHTLDLVLSMKVWRGVFFVCADGRVAALASEAAAPDGPPLEVIRNNAPEKGRRESVRLGVAAALQAASCPAPSGAGNAYYAFFPCDQPFLNAATVQRVLDARRPGCIAEARFHGKPGNPAVFSDFFRNELLTLEEGETPKHIKHRHSGRIIPVELPSARPLLDIDSRQDLRDMA
ncbi:MAG: nucleotidyltransferase family protein [Spirochaetaceae bacterium]|jgi:molybdenum cofactor cytidylyltransferase|nr:nucleotidyltransferase family protein [Spirochaetaceae bacterium]